MTHCALCPCIKVTHLLVRQAIYVDHFAVPNLWEEPELEAGTLTKNWAIMAFSEDVTLWVNPFTRTHLIALAI